nr:DUF3293 domain-containing protein [Pyrinomonadaceae bacterium]
MNKKELTRAYCNTSYRVRVSPEPIRLRVGERSAAFDEVLNSYGVTHWAFITAYNPRSRQLSDEENRRRHRDLLRKVKSINCQTLACEAKGDDGAWPAEEGLIVLD